MGWAEEELGQAWAAGLAGLGRAGGPGTPPPQGAEGSSLHAAPAQESLPRLRGVGSELRG
jgi:hypothetical protein